MSDTPNTENPPILTPEEETELKAYLAANPGAMPSKFAGNPDEFIKSYLSAQKKISEQGAELAKLRTPPTETPSVPPNETKADTPASGLDVKPPEAPPPEVQKIWATVQQEIAATNSLSPELRATLKQKFGIPDSLIEAALASQVAALQSARDTAYKAVGGKDKFDALLAWANTALQKQELEFIYAGLNSPAYLTVLQGLAARRASTLPTAGNPSAAPSPTNTPARGEAMFQSVAEVTAAMRDPRYKKDPAYRESVQRRIPDNLT